MTSLRSITAALLLLSSATVWAGDRFPGETWLRFGTPEQAGFSSAKLAEARDYWESLQSAALVVVRDGAVVVAWGDVDRRFLLHSARKSIMSAIYGLHVDAGTIDLQKTLGELGIDDENPPLDDQEKQARIVDLLAARSGVYHLAAAEPPQNQAKKPPRGSRKPGTTWCYNNWDFNTLCTIIEQEAGIKVFEEFGARFAEPLQMQDYRPRDGVYMYEREKSIHPAYHIRMSARDMARFGLLFLNQGNWNGRQILSREWVEESTRAHSTDTWFGSYGYMWWVYDQEPFLGLGMYSALGVGEQSIDVLPGADLVIVHRTNTFDRNQVSQAERLELIREILDARTGEPDPIPPLEPLPPVARDWTPAELTREQKSALCGELLLPPPWNMPVELRVAGDDLVMESPMGTFGLIPLTQNRFMLEDIRDDFYLETKGDGSVARVVTEQQLNGEGYRLLQAGDTEQAVALFEKMVSYFPDSANAHDSLGEAYMEMGRIEEAIGSYERSVELAPDNENALEKLDLLEQMRSEVR